jgi:hypothetical protein
MVLQNPDGYIAAVVIWAGRIIETLNRKEGTEITVLETPLDYWGRPAAGEFSQGRFIAQTPKFLDLVIYPSGRMITVAGEIIGKETKPLNMKFAGTGIYQKPEPGLNPLLNWQANDPFAAAELDLSQKWQDPFPRIYSIQTNDIVAMTKDTRKGL